ncbi:MAG: 50S ribosomal protein L19e [archaeon]
MNLSKKKALAAKALKVGKGRIKFNSENLGEIKEAITKQDILGLKQEGIISIKPVKGRKKIVRRKTRRGPGKIKKTVNKRKQIYVKITRKLRAYLKDLRAKGVVDRELYQDLRNKIRMRYFKSKSHFRDYLKNIELNLNKKIISKKTKKKEEKRVNKKKVEDTKKTKEKIK